ncbi:hypothetical protein P4O66_019392, partial [Electrophorus voltai]
GIVLQDVFLALHHSPVGKLEQLEYAVAAGAPSVGIKEVYILLECHYSLLVGVKIDHTSSSLILQQNILDNLYSSPMSPQGAYFAWKATAMGKNYVNGITFLEKRYNEDLKLEDAIHTAILTLKAC